MEIIRRKRTRRDLLSFSKRNVSLLDRGVLAWGVSEMRAQGGSLGSSASSVLHKRPLETKAGGEVEGPSKPVGRKLSLMVSERVDASVATSPIYISDTAEVGYVGA